MGRCVRRGWCVVGVAGDEIGSEEIEGERKPENPFVICMKETVFLLQRLVPWFVQKLHPNVENPAFGGLLLL